MVELEEIFDGKRMECTAMVPKSFGGRYEYDPCHGGLEFVTFDPDERMIFRCIECNRFYREKHLSLKEISEQFL